ncbi:MAG: hypothetical protein AB7P23_04485 [Amphiplicatus sp.]
MDLQGFLSALGLGDLVAKDFFALQLGAMTLTFLLFLGSLALCVLAFRAAGGASRARRGAETQQRAAQDLAVEIRHLAAQIERSKNRRAAVSAPFSPVKMSAAETTAEAEIEVLRAPDAQTPEGGDPALDEARRAASVPSALLGAGARRPA